MERESNLKKEEITEFVGHAQRLCEQKHEADMKALNYIKLVLRTCKDNSLGFSDKEDDEENFSINVPRNDGTMENLLVDAIRIDKNGNVFLEAEREKFYIWETDKSATEVFQYMMEEIEFEYEQENNQ